MKNGHRNLLKSQSFQCMRGMQTRDQLDVDLAKLSLNKVRPKQRSRLLKTMNINLDVDYKKILKKKQMDADDK